VLTVDPPAELDVDRLTRNRRVAWEDAEPAVPTGPACAHLDRAALHAALWERALRHPDIRMTGRCDVTPHGRVAEAPPRGLGRVVDATGCRAVTALAVLRPPRTWTAATLTGPAGDADPGLHLAAAPDGYAYRLGSGRRVTVGWVGPDRPPRDAAALARRIVESGCGWLLAGLDLPTGPTVRRPAGLALPVAAADAVPVGDAALTRDALASQGLSLALSDACLAADPTVATAALAARRADAVQRHLHHLRGTVGACRFAAAPAWARYGEWLDALARGVDDDVIPTSHSMIIPLESNTWSTPCHLVNGSCSTPFLRHRSPRILLPRGKLMLSENSRSRGPRR
jgi:hypothetical protein